MKYTWSFNDLFAKEFSNFPEDQQESILEFIATYQENGLSDFSKYEGKITPSWSGNGSEEDKDFAKKNHLWHYHIGIPDYKKKHHKFKTSDYVLHFQWKYKGNDIAIADLCYHYKYDGTFYLPNDKYLQ